MELLHEGTRERIFTEAKKKGLIPESASYSEVTHHVTGGKEGMFHPDGRMIEKIVFKLNDSLLEVHTTHSPSVFKLLETRKGSVKHLGDISI